MIEKLKNCPNCAGILDEAGRCKYCGSKVYDFLTLDFDGMGASASNAKTYIRVRSNGKIMLLPILCFGGASITIKPDITYAVDMTGERHVMSSRSTIELDLHCVCDDMVSVEEG